MSHIVKSSMRDSRMLDAKKIIDRINEAGIESQCHQLLNSCSLLPSLQLTRKVELPVRLFLCPKSVLLPERTSPARAHESGKFNHLKATTRSTIVAIRILRWASSLPRQSAIKNSCNHGYKKERRRAWLLTRKSYCNRYGNHSGKLAGIKEIGPQFNHD
jgi:hypothetical protein